MDDHNTYSPHQICEIFEISKSTLLRWEREGIIPFARRDPRTDQRLYTEEDFHIIGEQINKQIRQKFDRVVKSGDSEELLRTYEDLYVSRFIQGEPLAMSELENVNRLSASSIMKLWRFGLARYEPTSPMFNRLATLIATRSKLLINELV